MAFGAFSRFGVSVFRCRALADWPLALERRRIAHPKIQDYADFAIGLQQGFTVDEMGQRPSFPGQLMSALCRSGHSAPQQFLRPGRGAVVKLPSRLSEKGARVNCGSQFSTLIWITAA
jgi:hypothetical protein